MERPKDIKNVEANPEIKYNRDLAVKLFYETHPFVSLGYGPRQREEAMRAIRQLENEQAIVISPTWAEFHSENNLYGSTIEGLPRTEGFRFTAIRYIKELIRQQLPESTPEAEIEKRYFFYKPRVQFFDWDPFERMVSVSVLPADFGYSDLESLVPAVLETETFEISSAKIRKANLFNKLRSRLQDDRRNPMYRSAWVDDETKLDFVVQFENRTTRFLSSQGIVPKNGVVEVWRRLPVIELDGHEWVPFGKKLNVNIEQAMKAFEKTENVFVGQFAGQAQR